MQNTLRVVRSRERREREGSDGEVKGEGEGRRGEERRMDGESNSECQC